jgi:predicted O-methyltransferase YrrM
MTSLRDFATKLYQDWDYRHGLYGKPDPFFTRPFTRIADRKRWGPLGECVWQSRRVPGWAREHEAVALAQASFGVPENAVVVELGSFLGCSAVLLAGARKARGSGRVHCIDPFDASGDAFSVPIYREIQGSGSRSLRARFERNLERAGVRDWVEVHPVRAEQAVETWSAPIDLLFFDGHQSYDVVMATYDAWSPFLKPGSTLAIHNSRPGYRRETHDGSARLVEELVRPPRYDSVELVKSITFARKAAREPGEEVGA